jgi:membrane protease YdiL (CAAX protease family)
MEKRIVIVLVLVLALVFAEILLNLNEIVGFILYISLIALALLSLSQVPSLNDYGQLIIVLMIMPIVRATELLITLDFFWKILISYCILLFLTFYYSTRFKLNHGHRKEKLGLLPLVTVIGLAFGLIGNFLFNLDKYPWIYFILLIAYSEEILFRGMIQNLLKKVYGINVAILTSALLYGSFSLGHGVLFALFMFSVGIVIGLIYGKTKNIFLAVVLNLVMHYFLLV